MFDLSNIFNQPLTAIIFDFVTLIILVLLFVFLFMVSNTARKKVIACLIFILYYLFIDFINANLSLSILGSVLSVWPILIFISFSEEILQLTRNFEFHNHSNKSDEDNSHLTRTIVSSIEKLSKNKTGALLVFEGAQSLEALVEKSISIDSVITEEMLITLFNTTTPMHDGAVIIRNGRIVCAGVFFQPSTNPNISKQLGSRHRAALGASELYDALVIVVSEETGKISIALEGKLERNLDSESLYQYILEYI